MLSSFLIVHVNRQVYELKGCSAPHYSPNSRCHLFGRLLAVIALFLANSSPISYS